MNTISFLQTKPTEFLLNIFGAKNEKIFKAKTSYYNATKSFKKFSEYYISNTEKPYDMEIESFEIYLQTTYKLTNIKVKTRIKEEKHNITILKQMNIDCDNSVILVEKTYTNKGKLIALEHLYISLEDTYCEI